MSKWVTPDFMKAGMEPPSKRKKTNTTSASSRSTTSKSRSKIPAKKIPTSTTVSSMKCSTDWLANFDPRTESDLAVHTKKVQEVKQWLMRATQRRNRNDVLLVTGPTGSGKTATIKVLCNDLNITFNEWVTPLDMYTYERDDEPVKEKPWDAFRGYLHRASRYRSLYESSDAAATVRGRIVLVEDFPNYLLRDPAAIETVLSWYKECGRAPLVFVCADTADRDVNIARKVFTDVTRERHAIDVISFNPVAATNLKQALRRALGILASDGRYRTDAQRISADSETLEAILYSSIGDLRSVLNNLCFAMLKDSTARTSSATGGGTNGTTAKTDNVGGGTSGIELERVIELPEWTVKTPGGTKRSRPGKAGGTRLKNMGREEQVGLLHAVGRVLNPKRLLTTYGYTFSHPVDETCAAFQSACQTFLGFLHQNYVGHFRCLEDLAPAAECLSEAEVHAQYGYLEPDMSQYALWLAVAGLQIHNLEPVKHWAPVRAPHRLEVKIPSCRELSLGVQHSVHGHSRALDFKTYSRRIMMNRKTLLPANSHDATSHDDDDVDDEEMAIEEIDSD